MKQILLFGAGKSATVLIEYMLDQAPRENWNLVVADADIKLAQGKVKKSLYGQAVSLNVQDAEKRKMLIAAADLVISLLPPALHILVAKDCIQLKKNLLTASYVDDEMKKLNDEVESRELLFLCEMGLDPGIDHMSAKKIIDEIHTRGGGIISFLSHAGGLIAPQSDDNPWHYKISWNPANVVHAGKSGARFLQDGEVKQLSYPGLFADKRYVAYQNELFCWYPNRNSLPYISLYGVEECRTFIRTTLRHPDFMYGWKNLIDLKLTDESIFYETKGKSLGDFFSEHMEKNNFGQWLEQKLRDQFDVTKDLLANLMNLAELEQESTDQGIAPIENFMLVNDKGKIENVDIEELKTNAAATIAFKMHESKLTLSQLFFLGMNDEETKINKGRCSAADVLQFALEKKLALKPKDKDRVVMLHEVEYEQDGQRYKLESVLDVAGESRRHTAMAKTVGLPLGIAAKLILNGTIGLKGIQVPVSKEVYEPVLNELAQHGIEFLENIQPLP